MQKKVDGKVAIRVTIVKDPKQHRRLALFDGKKFLQKGISGRRRAREIALQKGWVLQS